MKERIIVLLESWESAIEEFTAIRPQDYADIADDIIKLFADEKINQHGNA